MTSLQSRILVAAIGAPLLIWVVLWAPPHVMDLMLALLSGIAAWELVKCAASYQAWKWPAALLAALVELFVMTPEGGRFPLPVLLTALTMVCFAVAVFQGGRIRLLDILVVLFSVSAIPYAFGAFLRIHVAGHRGYLLLPFLFSFASDTFAFFAGRAFGRHKLAPHVSPNKTVEGAVGGLAGNVVCGLIFALVMNTWFGQDLSLGGMALTGLGCSVVAQLGDLSFSLIKREFGIKDYGHIFLAHGGVLDRFDSVLFVAPALEVLIHLAGLVQSHG